MDDKENGAHRDDRGHCILYRGVLDVEAVLRRRHRRRRETALSQARHAHVQLLTLARLLVIFLWFEEWYCALQEK